MSPSQSDDPEAHAEPRTTSRETRAYSQLLRQQERARELLQQIIEELGAPVTDALLAQLDHAPSTRVRERLEKISARIEAAKRLVSDCESVIHRSLVTSRGESPPPAGPANLPPALARFLAERKDSPHFSFDVTRDPVRGWIVRWKDYEEDGSVCGGGRFYEKPYAWMDP